jgi:hypothetical protein
MSRYGRSIDPLRGSGVSRSLAAPGVAPIPVIPDQTANQVAGIVGESLRATSAVVDFMAGAERIRIGQEREAAARAAEDQAQYEQTLARTEALQRSEATEAARLRAVTLEGEVERGDVMIPPSADAETIRNTAILFGEDEASRLFPDSPAAREAYSSAITQAYAQNVVRQLDRVTEEERGFAVARYQSAGLTDPAALAEGERNLFPGQPDRATLELYLPVAKTLAESGDVAGLERIAPRLEPLLGGQLQKLKDVAAGAQERQRSEILSQQVTTAALNTSEALTGGRIEDILLQRERLRDQMKANPDLARYFDGPIATLNNASDRYFGEQAKAVQAARVANARQSTLGSFFAMTMQPGLGKADVLEADGLRVVDNGQVVAKIDAAEVERTMKTAARAYYARPENRPGGESQVVAYSRWSQQNGYPMSEESSMMRIDARALKAAALAPTDERNRPTIQSAVGNFRMYRELRAAGTDGQLGELDGDMAVYEAAIDILESNPLAGQQMTEEQALIQAARFAAKPRPMQEAEREAVRNQAEKLLDRAPWIPFTRAEDSEVAKDNVSEFANILMMRNPNLRPVDAVKRAAEVVKAKSRIVNGHYTFFRDEVPDPGFGQEYSFEDAGSALAGILHEQIKDDTAYVWNNKKIGKGDIRLTQDPQSRMLSFVDNRTGDVLRYRHDDGAVTMTFTAEDLKTAMRSNATSEAMKRRAEAKAIDNAMRNLSTVRYGGLE